MPRFDNLRESAASIGSEPFVIGLENGEKLLVGRIRLLFNTEKAGVQIIVVDAQPGVKILYPRKGFLNFLPQIVDLGDQPPEIA